MQPLQPPEFTFSLLKTPPLPGFPTTVINVFGDKLVFPNYLALPQFFANLVAYVFEWGFVQAANVSLVLVSVVYTMFGMLEYGLLSLLLSATNALGIFSLPAFVLIFGLSGVAIYTAVSLGEDAATVGVMAGG